MRRIVLIAALLAAPLAAPAAASANKMQESVFQDDHMLPSGEPALQHGAFEELDALGVDTIHSLVSCLNLSSCCLTASDEYCTKLVSSR